MFGQKKKTKSMDAADWQFIQSIQNQHLPILTLDPNWHALFVNNSKTPAIKTLEARMTTLLKQQGKLNNDNKEMQQQKKHLMSQIIYNMSDDGEEMDDKKSASGRRIEEINEKVIRNEDELGVLPEQIRHVNEALLLETFKTVYSQMEVNQKRVAELDEYIGRIRQDLTSKLLEKQSREEYNQNIFSNLNNIVGMNAVDVFDQTHKKDRR